MKRRAFLTRLATAAAAIVAAPTILPAATTYARARWKRPPGLRFFTPHPVQVGWDLGAGSITNCCIIRIPSAELERIFRLDPTYKAYMERLHRENPHYESPHWISDKFFGQTP